MGHIERDEEIVKDYQAGRRIGDICRENGLGERQFYNIIARVGAEAPKMPRPKDPLSLVHKNIGTRVYEFYFQRGLDRRMAANKLGWSALRLRSVELGLTDLTLFELQDLAAFIGVSIEQVINGNN